jgi:hypothetical protein
MTKNKIVFFLLALVANQALAQGFQQLPWGATVATIERAFPSAKPKKASQEMFPACSNADGTKRLCTIATMMCEKFEECHPSLILVDYTVGTYKFSVSFDLSKAKRLSSVELTLQDSWLGQSVQGAESIHSDMFKMLSKKYGDPYRSEGFSINANRPAPCEQWGCVYSGWTKWRTKDSEIILKTGGVFNESTKRILQGPTRPGSSISYHPLIGEAEQRL